MLLVIGTCPLHVITLDFGSDIVIQNCFVQLCKVYNAIWKSSSKSDVSTWSSAYTSVLITVSIYFNSI
jgi:hypothetical protein